jgi:nitrite reductase (NADH) large subunit
MDLYDLDPSKPLQGQRIVLPRVDRVDGLAAFIAGLGADVRRLCLSAERRDPELCSVDRWLAPLLAGDVDDVILASAHALRVVVEYAEHLDQDEALRLALGRCRRFVRGPAVVAELGKLGIRPTAATPDDTLESLLGVLPRFDFAGHTVGLQPHGKSRETELCERLRDAGANLLVLGTGSTTLDPAQELVELAAARRLDAVVLTSGVQVEQLLDAKTRGTASVASVLSGTRVIAIGEGAGSTLREHGVHVDATGSHELLASPSAAEIARLFGLELRASVAGGPAVFVRQARGGRAGEGRTRVLVVGNGMVGHRFCERLVELDVERRIQVTIVGEESRTAYDRVNLTKYLSGKSEAELALAGPSFYAENEIELRTGTRVVSVDRSGRSVTLSSGETLGYDVLVFATGSAAFVPPVAGVDKQGVFVYRTIDDLDRIAAHAAHARSAAVIGGGLLGLEAAKAVLDLGVQAHVIEFAPRLMPRQLDDLGARLLRAKIEALGVHVHTSKATKRVRGAEAVDGLVFEDGSELAVQMVVLSAGIVPRDEVARSAGIVVGERGGIVVGDDLRTSDPRIFAIGECALHRRTTYGLVAPGYDMADVLARRLTGTDALFEGADVSAKLKLLGVDVASLGDAFGDGAGKPSIVLCDLVSGVYKKLVLSEDKKRLVGGMLVGDATEYGQLMHHARSGAPLPERPEELIVGARSGGGGAALPDDAQVCSCNNVSKGDICRAVREQEAHTATEVARCTRAATGCGGCAPMVSDVLQAELKALGKAQIKAPLCEHFAYTRRELYEIVKVRRLRTFRELLDAHGKGLGCEICKPTVASILASVHNELVVRHDTLQDTNDRFLANLQRRGLYSVVPRVAGGEITPEKLIVLGQVAQKYGLYTKITGGQRIDLFGARVEQLPAIWEELVDAGFESGHAYGKSMRTVKSCVGSTWCRYGVQDSVGMAIRVENRYKGIRAPHKLKSAVSGCVRECAEAQSKDFGLIATEKGYNVYVCGNGGAKPRHADLLATDVDEETAIRYLDRFIMYYIETADRLTRTSVWLEKMEGGIEYLRDVVVHDKLGICADLERHMQGLVDTYACEWAAVVRSPELRKKFVSFVNAPTEPGDAVELVEERGQKRPADWVSAAQTIAPLARRRSLPLVNTSWVKVGRVADFPTGDGGMAVRYGKAQIAVFHVERTGRWYATQNQCPHRRDMVLARGIVGDAGGTPKIACPVHKKTFSLESGVCLNDDAYAIRTFPVKVERGEVYVELPPLDAALDLASCAAHEPAPAEGVPAL